LTQGCPLAESLPMILSLGSMVSTAKLPMWPAPMSEQRDDEADFYPVFYPAFIAEGTAFAKKSKEPGKEAITNHYRASFR
jgi:hypothetical protein